MATKKAQYGTALLVAAALFLGCGSNAAQETQVDSVKAQAPEAEQSKFSDEEKARHEKFQKALANTKFVGKFTITGMDTAAPKDEEYTISTVKKLPKGDLWEITARIKYGDHDLKVPMVMEIKWAGKTPVITVDRMVIPGMGTFDARVLLRKDKYAGTWTHDKTGGHLFGRIEKLDEE